VPGQIVVAFVAELKLYRFRGVGGMFPELLRILEKHDARGWAERPFPKLLCILETAGATGSGMAPVALRIGWIGLAPESDI
jgi:hypothetical protein